MVATLGCLGPESSQIIQILWNELAEQLLLKKIQLAEEKPSGEFNLILYKPGLNNSHRVYRYKSMSVPPAVFQKLTEKNLNFRFGHLSQGVRRKILCRIYNWILMYKHV